MRNKFNRCCCDFNPDNQCLISDSFAGDSFILSQLPHEKVFSGLFQVDSIVLGTAGDTLDIILQYVDEQNYFAIRLIRRNISITAQAVTILNGAVNVHEERLSITLTSKEVCIEPVDGVFGSNLVVQFYNSQGESVDTILFSEYFTGLNPAAITGQVGVHLVSEASSARPFYYGHPSGYLLAECPPCPETRTPCKTCPESNDPTDIENWSVSVSGLTDTAIYEGCDEFNGTILLERNFTPQTASEGKTDCTWYYQDPTQYPFNGVDFHAGNLEPGNCNCPGFTCPATSEMEIDFTITRSGAQCLFSANIRVRQNVKFDVGGVWCNYSNLRYTAQVSSGSYVCRTPIVLQKQSNQSPVSGQPAGPAFCDNAPTTLTFTPIIP